MESLRWGTVDSSVGNFVNVVLGSTGRVSRVGRKRDPWESLESGKGGIK